MEKHWLNKCYAQLDFASNQYFSNWCLCTPKGLTVELHEVCELKGNNYLINRLFCLPAMVMWLLGIVNSKITILLQWMGVVYGAPKGTWWCIKYFSNVLRSLQNFCVSSRNFVFSHKDVCIPSQNLSIFVPHRKARLTWLNIKKKHDKKLKFDILWKNIHYVQKSNVPRVFYKVLSMGWKHIKLHAPIWAHLLFCA